MDTKFIFTLENGEIEYEGLGSVDENNNFSGVFRRAGYYQHSDLTFPVWFPGSVEVIISYVNEIFVVNEGMMNQWEYTRIVSTKKMPGGKIAVKNLRDVVSDASLCDAVEYVKKIHADMSAEEITAILPFTYDEASAALDNVEEDPSTNLVQRMVALYDYKLVCFATGHDNIPYKIEKAFYAAYDNRDRRLAMSILNKYAETYWDTFERTCTDILNLTDNGSDFFDHIDIVKSKTSFLIEGAVSRMYNYLADAFRGSQDF